MTLDKFIIFFSENWKILQQFYGSEHPKSEFEALELVLSEKHAKNMIFSKRPRLRGQHLSTLTITLLWTGDGFLFSSSEFLFLKGKTGNRHELVLNIYAICFNQ